MCFLEWLCGKTCKKLWECGLKHNSNRRNLFCIYQSQNYLRDSKLYTMNSYSRKCLDLCNCKESHCMKYARISHLCISQKLKRCFNVKSSTYCFHMKTKILADFQICISVHLFIYLFFSCPEYAFSNLYFPV